MKTKNLTPLPYHTPEINDVYGNYRPHFFCLKAFQILKVINSSIFFADKNPEYELLHSEGSFYFLREDKMRVLNLWTNNGNHLPFGKFLMHFGLQVNSDNLFKVGKYLSRIFRATKYGGFFQKLNVKQSDIGGKAVDGISILSLEAARALGWLDACPGHGAQITYLSARGLLKGHCLISDQINHDLIIYRDNMKDQIILHEGLEYLALEPVKLSNSLRIDIQTLLNLWTVFGSEQYLSWALRAIESFQSDLFSGKISNWLDTFEHENEETLETESWTLQRAIWHKIPYTQYPGLVRAGWAMFRKSILSFTQDSKSQYVFHIPVPGGRRGYIRVDLRCHDQDGNFISQTEAGTVELDKHGNLWINKSDIEAIEAILGGADQDDACGIIPIEGNRAVLYRNPNQFGECIITKIKYVGISVEEMNQIFSELPIKEISSIENPTIERDLSGNRLLERVYSERKYNKKLEYTLVNLIKAYNSLKNNRASIGIAANADMLRTALMISHPPRIQKQLKQFSWNLERVIDASVRDGFGADHDMAQVNSLFSYIADRKISIPSSLLSRIPEKYRSRIKVDKNHPLEELLSALEYVIKDADVRVLGKGSASRGNRTNGLIDQVEVPLRELGIFALDNQYLDLAVSILKNYNKEIAILMEQTQFKEDADQLRQLGIESIQCSLLKHLSGYNEDVREQLTNIWAYEIYKSPSFVHDSILWISDKNNLRGTARDSIKMLSSLGLGMEITSYTKPERQHVKYDFTKHVNSVRTVRVWAKYPLPIESFQSITEITICGKEVLLNDLILNLGEDTPIGDGVYTVTTLAHSTSKRDSSKILKNSLTVYLR